MSYFNKNLKILLNKLCLSDLLKMWAFLESLSEASREFHKVTVL